MMLSVACATMIAHDRSDSSPRPLKNAAGNFVVVSRYVELDSEAGVLLNKPTDNALIANLPIRRVKKKLNPS